MTATLSSTDTQPGLFAARPTAHEQAGFELGWDYAHHRRLPPAPYATEPSSLHAGLIAGRAAFGARTLPAGRYVGRWLELRLHAWLRGRSVEPVQVTPNYLQQIDVDRCPITREPLAGGAAGLDDGPAGASDAPAALACEPGVARSIDRVRDDAGVAAGNLAVMSLRANHAKGSRGRAEALEIVARLQSGSGGTVDGLDADEWARIASLCSFVEPMSHADACRVPMRLLPPNRLRLFNPVQALQAFVSRQFLRPNWSERVAAFAELLPNHALRRDFRAFFIALLPRVIEAGGAGDAARARRAVEDAWAAPRVQQHWERFAAQLDPAACERLLARATAARLGTGLVMPVSERGATDGWALPTRGWLPGTRAGSRPPTDRQHRLVW